MKNPDKAIVCGACNVPIVCPMDPEPHHQMICPRCGARDTYEQTFKVALEHAEYSLKSAWQRSLRVGGQNLSGAIGSAAPNEADQPFFKWRIRD